MQVANFEVPQNMVDMFWKVEVMLKLGVGTMFPFLFDVPAGWSDPSRHNCMLSCFLCPSYLAATGIPSWQCVRMSCPIPINLQGKCDFLTVHGKIDGLALWRIC